MIQTDLGGHSGCKVMLMEPDGRRAFVRKISGSIHYNDRLLKQMTKQAGFTQGNVKTPRLLGDGYTDDGLFYFDMEYIYGITLAEYMNSLRVNEIRGLVDAILDDIVDTNSIKDETGDVNSIFGKKIDSLKIQLEGQDNIVINEALGILSQHDWSVFHKSFCHGDLTLENIIVKDNEFYAIDFLDSFYDCWIMDISTLMQDVQTLWSYRMNEKININTLIRLIIFRDILMDSVKDRAGGAYMEVYYALLLKLVRIYPYTKNGRTYRFLNEKTRSVMEIIKRSAEVGEKYENVDYSVCRRA